MSDKIFRFAARKSAAMTASAHRHTGQRVRAQVKIVSQGALALASAEMCNEAIIRFISLCYEHDPDIDDFANIDIGTHRILISVPWGHLHHRYGLRPGEAKVLAHYIMSLQSGGVAQRIPPVFVWAPEFSRWILNTEDHPIQRSALDYWRKMELTAKKYMTIARALRTKRTRRASKERT